MITLIFVLLTLLGIQHPVIAIDGLEKEFVVSQLVEQSLTGCTENPQGGAFGGDPLTVDWLKSPEPSTTPNATSTWFPNGVAGTETATVQPMSMRVVPVDPPNPNPDPNPSTPPVAATPEPSSMAILGITAATLLFLLFGRQYGRRLSRR